MAAGEISLDAPGRRGMMPGAAVLLGLSKLTKQMFDFRKSGSRLFRV
jgi:hypothetical protein